MLGSYSKEAYSGSYRNESKMNWNSYRLVKLGYNRVYCFLSYENKNLLKIAVTVSSFLSDLREWNSIFVCNVLSKIIPLH